MKNLIEIISNKCLHIRRGTLEKRVLPETVISLVGLLLFILSIPVITAVKLVLDDETNIYFNRGATTSWTTDMVYWLDAQDLDADGSAEGIAGETGQNSGQVSTWTNKTGGTDFTITAGQSNGTTPDLKEDQINFNAAIHFNESVTTDYLGAQVTDFPTTEITQFIVFKSTGVSDGIFSYATTGHDNEFLIFGQESLTVIKENSAVNTSLDLNAGEPAILSLDRVSSTGSTNVFVNANGYAGNAFSLLLGDMDNTGTVILAQEQDNLGGGLQAHQAMPGQIAEVITYNAVLSATEQQAVNSYLAIKYGITLDQSSGTDYLAANGIVIWDYSENTSYIYDIGGIGKDNDSDLNQPKSKSENSDEILTIGKNSGVTLTDGTHLIWGNNNGSTSTIEPVTVGDRYGKMTRQWRIQEKNRTDAGSGIGTVTELGNIDITFDLTGINYTTSEVQLLIDDDGTFGNGSTVSGVTGSFVGDVVTFSNVDVDDSQFISIALFEVVLGGVADGLVYWLDAQDLDGDGSAEGTAGETGQSLGQVSTWANKTGGTDFTITAGLSDGTTPDLKEDQINFNAAIDFNESVTSDYLGAQVTDFPTTEITQFIVFRSSGSGDGIFSYATAGHDNELLLFDQSSLFTIKEVRLVNTGLDLNGGEVNILSFDRVSSTGSTNVFVNASGYVNNPYSLLSGDMDNTGTIILAQEQDEVGGGMAASQAMPGQVAEVITYNAVLSTVEQQAINSYLAIKYGITLDQSSGTDYLAANGSILWDYSENTSYISDIGGIGKDDDSGLNQPKSKSENSDAILTIEKNTGVTLADGAHLLWGNNNGNTSSTEEVTVGARYGKMTRQWRVQEKNRTDAGSGIGTVTELGNIDITFDLSGTNYTANDVRLLIDDDGTFGSGSTVSSVAGSFVGDVVTFANIDIDDGQFISVALFGIGPGGVADDLVYWLDAQDLDGDGTPEGIASESGQSSGQVTTWVNKTGGTDFNTSAGVSAGTTPDLKEAEINFNESIEYNESVATDYLGAQVTDFPSNTLTQYLVMKSSGGGDGFFSYATADDDNEFLFLNQGNINLYVNDVVTFVPANNLNDDEAHILTVDRSSGAANIFKDGLAHGGNPYSVNAGALTSTGTIILSQDQDSEGGGFQVTQDYKGHHAEVITYGSVLSTNNRKRVDSYLAIKYGITLDQTSGNDYTNSHGDIIWDYSANTSYVYNVAGIGRDDNSLLIQKQSRSINSDAIVTIGLDDDVSPDGLETSNVLNDGSFSIDRSFLTWSNDGAAIDAVGDNSEKDEMLTHARLNREWRVQETGTIGTVTVQVDVSSISGPTGIGTNDESQIQLMVDADGDFSSGASLVYQSFVTPGDGLVKFRIDFTDGQFFTLASGEIGALPVDLISFGAEVKEETVAISWSTAVEIENALFRVLRSSNGLDFEEIANVSGSETSQIQNNYSLIDTAPLEGVNYYRLEDIDLLGNSKYSSIVSVQYSRQFHPSLAIYPNPVERGQDLNIMISESGGREKLQVFDRYGRALSIDKMNPITGSTTMKLSTKSLESGIYLVRYITNNGQAQSLKLIIK